MGKSQAIISNQKEIQLTTDNDNHDDHDNIIDITDRLLHAAIARTPGTEWIDAGLSLLKHMDRDEADIVVRLVANLLITECRVGLGLEDPDDLDLDSLKFFPKIDALYSEARGDCYFCNPDVDPNAMEFSGSVSLCYMCKLKLANFVQALGIEPGQVFKGMPRRIVQKTRIVLKGD
jgi:hypothetical protein